jgi:putative FmdB family regulatory protein
MAILVDYRCRSCAARFEQWVSRPAPHRLICPACGADASRAWSPVALGGRARAVREPGTDTAISTGVHSTHEHTHVPRSTRPPSR